MLKFNKKEHSQKNYWKNYWGNWREISVIISQNGVLLWSFFYIYLYMIVMGGWTRNTIKSERGVVSRGQSVLHKERSVGTKKSSGYEYRKMATKRKNQFSYMQKYLIFPYHDNNI